MARLESRARAGYFATPPRVAAAIARQLAPVATGGKRVLRLLDPCAGEGQAAATIAAALGARSYGIELNEGRATAARARLDHVLAASAFAVRLANGAFSCLFLNPPYDHDDEHVRLEHAFLVGLSRALCPGGVLVFVLPQRRLAVSARYLAGHFTGHAAYRFPDPEWATFGQLVLLAIRKAQPSPDPAAQARLAVWSEAALPPLPDEPDPATPCFRPPALPGGEVLFAPLFFDPAQAAAEAQQRGVWASPQLTEQLWPPDERPVRPLMPLRKGHLALLIAAGMLNNVALERDGRRVLVKGRTYKDLVATPSDDDTTLVEREVLRTSVMLLDLGTGALQAVEQGSGRGQASPAHQAGAADRVLAGDCAA